eukprot:symbB.v1.2.021145.t1/scaffold1812.1/size105704/9
MQLVYLSLFCQCQQQEHPGGAAVLQRHTGQDATEAFLAVGHSQEAWALLSRLPVVSSRGLRVRQNIEYSSMVEPPGTQDLGLQLLHLAAAVLLTFIPRFLTGADEPAGVEEADLIGRPTAVPSAALGLAVIGFLAQFLPFSPPLQVPSVRQVLQGISIMILAFMSLQPPRVLALAAAFASGITCKAPGHARGVLAWALLMVQAGPMSAPPSGCFEEVVGGLPLCLQRMSLSGAGAGALLGLWDREPSLQFIDAVAAALAALRCAGMLSLVCWLLLMSMGQVQLEVVAAARLSVQQLSGETIKVMVDPSSVTVFEIKRQIAQELECPTFLITLLSNGSILQASQELQTVDLEDLTVVRFSPTAESFAAWDGDEDLLQAVEQCDVSWVDQLLARGPAQQPRVVKTPLTPLLVACQQGNCEVAELLLQAKADIHSGGCYGKSPLQMAAERDHLEVARLLVEAKADLNSTSRYGRSPLQIACERGHLKVVRLLILAGVDVNLTGRYGRTPLQLACEHGHLQTARVLLRCGAEINKKGTFGGAPMQLAAEKGHLELMRCLAQARNADVNITSRFGRSPLQLASEQGHLDLVNFLIDSGAAINTKHYGRTSLQLASEQGHAEVVERLLQAGANAEVRGSYGRTPWQLACEKGHFQVVRVLLQTRGQKSGSEKNLCFGATERKWVLVLKILEAF